MSRKNEPFYAIVSPGWIDGTFLRTSWGMNLENMKSICAWNPDLQIEEIGRGIIWPVMSKCDTKENEND